MHKKTLNLRKLFNRARALKCIALVLLSMALLSGCSSTKNTTDSLSSGLLLAEPEMLSTKAQLAVAHYTNSLYRLQFTEQERAEMLFQRGLAFDSLGLISLARRDYAESIVLKPRFAQAHNSLGVLYTQANMHMQAYDAFDASLEIDPSYNFALLNRAIALYYGGRAQLAVDDTSTYLAQDPTDPFRLLWHFIVYRESSNDEAAKIMLNKARGALFEQNWASSLADYYLGIVNESAVIAALLRDVTSPTQLNHRLCEAYFYLGKHSAYLGKYTKAENYFKLSLSTNVFEYIEHKYARIELAKVRRARLDEMQAQ
ncbi:lipoprotein NlpI [Glaciecola punicea]|uniref:lipoprotein NlpI n=1 Tax=Glaciecola punicea TaxID=56804 RepID=UPI000AA4BD1C